MRVVDVLLGQLPSLFLLEEVEVGTNWTLALVRSPEGLQHAGLAASPFEFGDRSRFRVGSHQVALDAHGLAQLVHSSDGSAASVGFAAINALMEPAPGSLQDVDAADWLVVHAPGKRVAIIGRFPFVEGELSPVAEELWVFEREPQPGEYGPAEMSQLLPRADIIAITSSAVVNHSIDEILSYVLPRQTTMLLGPSTPLCACLFPLGIQLLSGVQVTDVAAVRATIRAGRRFQNLSGLRRVTMVSDVALLRT